MNTCINLSHRRRRSYQGGWFDTPGAVPLGALSTTAHPLAVRRTSSQFVGSEKIGPASKIFTSARSARRIEHSDGTCDIVALAHSPT
ncbi:MAG TPA: hypothetical protein VFC03_12830 [Acidimicrobiales bacterium]|nr:hypothetical protein [Acidimicrobiales bacterium]